MYVYCSKSRFVFSLFRFLRTASTLRRVSSYSCSPAGHEGGGAETLRGVGCSGRCGERKVARELASGRAAAQSAGGTLNQITARVIAANGDAGLVAHSAMHSAVGEHAPAQLDRGSSVEHGGECQKRRVGAHYVQPCSHPGQPSPATTAARARLAAHALPERAFGLSSSSGPNPRQRQLFLLTGAVADRAGQFYERCKNSGERSKKTRKLKGSQANQLRARYANLKAQLV